MIEFYQLEQLVTVAKEGTLSKAADVLLISQPGLTRAMQRLENDLEMKLFDRKKNKITLNDNGELAVKLAQKVLEQREQMIKTLKSYENSKHTIHIGSSCPAPIWELKDIFKEIYPNMKLSETLDSDEEVLIAGLKSLEFSIIVLTHPIENDNFKCIRLFDEQLYFSVPPAHPFSLFKEISFDDINGESVLLLSRIGYWNEVCLKMIPQSHLLFQEEASVFDELTKASALPNFRSNLTIERDGKEDNRVAIPIIDQEASVTYYAIYRKKDKSIFDFLNEKFNQK